jgi:cytochrome c oxidase subunit 4
MSAHSHSDDGHDFAHPMPIPVLLAVFVALTVLTIITVAQSNFDLGGFDIMIVMGIATVKATLVVAFFMHLAFDKPFNVIVFLAGFVFAGIFVSFTLSDSQMTADAFEPIIEDVAPPAVEADAAPLAVEAAH